MNNMQCKPHRELHPESTYNPRGKSRRAGVICAPIVLAGLTLGGCASTPAANPVAMAVNHQILQTSQSVHREIVSLLAIREAGVHPTTRPAPNRGPLAKRITLLWSGPMAPAVRAVAGLIGYRFRTEGAKPPITPMVHINTSKEHAYDVLRDIGLQAGMDTGVIIDRADRTLVVSYHGRTNPGAGGAQ
jgi:hypothetical protein